MSRRKAYEKIDINVEPFLSIMAIVLKLISLILVVIVMRIAMNPKGKRIIAFEGLYSGHGNVANPKIPSYVDCRPDGLTLYSSEMPGGTQVGWDDLQRPDNAMSQLLDKVQQRKEEEYVVVIVRPQSVKFYRTVRNLIEKRPIDVGYDAIDADFKVDWNEAEKGLAISAD
jgi:hypothetical protein